MSSSHNQPGVIYEIQVQGELDRGWQQWFNGLDVRLTYASEQLPTTTLSGSLADQAALRGLLCRLWDLNLSLLSVRRVGVEEWKEEEDD